MSNGESDYAIAFGIKDYFIHKVAPAHSFEFAFNNFIWKNSDDFKFGYLGYGLKNEFEPTLKRGNADPGNFPDAYFFVPKHVFIRQKGSGIYFGSAKPESIDDILEKERQHHTADLSAIDLQLQISKRKYLDTVHKLKQEIQEGNIYEINYCVNFASRSSIDYPNKLFSRLINRTNAPFSAYLNLKFQRVLCASPERFLNLKGNKLMSQPIKGTARRGTSELEDEELKKELRNNKKEVAENVMIVDLVRNDLSKIAKPKSVRVEKLNDVMSFKSVHQLVSTVSCKVKDELSPADIFKALFPMGSMTGAPKISAMELSERFEMFGRGLYSGAIGFIDPNGNFDFNVVIRSIFQNKRNNLVYSPVGGAITIQSDPEKEYEECLTKLKATREALSSIELK